MLRQHPEQRHIDLDSGRSCLALEREHWQALEVVAYEDGLNNRRDFLYRYILPNKPDDRLLANIYLDLVKELLFRHNHMFYLFYQGLGSK